MVQYVYGFETFLVKLKVRSRLQKLMKQLFSEQVQKLFWVRLIISLLLAYIPTNNTFASNSINPPALAPSSTLSDVCQQAANTEWWSFGLSTDYSRSAQDENTSYETNQTADMELVFGMPVRSDNQVMWILMQSKGTGKVYDYVNNPDASIKMQGQGSAIASGFLYLDLDTCTYDFETLVLLEKATETTREGTRQVQYLAISELHVINKPIESIETKNFLSNAVDTDPIAKPRLAWSGSLPAVTDITRRDIDAYLSNGTAANQILGIYANQGSEFAGYASVSWSATRIGVTDIAFKQQLVPSKEWVDVPADGTVDGNKVQIIATINNPSDNLIPGPVRFVDAETNQLLPNGEIKLQINPHSREQVIYEWDTQGWAWNDGNGTGAHSLRTIRVELATPEKIYDFNERAIVVRPKPVILVHGLNSNASTWATYPAMLKAVNPKWNAYAIENMRTGDDPSSQQESNTILDNAKALNTFIEQIRVKDQAWQVDIVAHSMGGLISRQYIHSFMQAAPTINSRPLVRNLAMLGTPNQGSLCAIGLTAINYKLGIDNIIAPIELIPHVVASFNQKVTQQRGVHFSVIAGNANIYPCVPPGFGLLDKSDLVVTVKSAHHTYTDIGFTSKNHLEMTSDNGIFNTWVVRHLALGKNITQNRIAENKPSATGTDDQLNSLQFNQIAQHDLKANGDLDVPLTITKSSGLYLMLIAPAGVSSSLIDPSGKVVDSVAAGSERAIQPFRALQASAPAVGTWKLRLHNTLSQNATIAYGLTLVDSELQAQSTFEYDSTNKQIVLQFSLNKQQQAQAAAKVSAELVANDGTRTTVQLYDDGKHGDGAAGDGVFGASAPVAADKQYIVLYTAQLGQETLVSIATATTPAQAQGAVVYLPFVSYKE
jgi:pimeloyl-ACP methyl ester carboxylesterase